MDTKVHAGGLVLDPIETHVNQTLFLAPFGSDRGVSTRDARDASLHPQTHLDEKHDMAWIKTTVWYSDKLDVS